MSQQVNLVVPERTKSKEKKLRNPSKGRINSRPNSRPGGGGTLGLTLTGEKWEEEMHESPYLQELQSSVKKMTISRKWYQ